MTSLGNSSLVVTLGIGALIAWRVYVRIGKLVRRQKASPMRLWGTVIFYPLFIATLLPVAIADPARAAALAGGVVLGIGLGVYGLRMTTFEDTTEGLFYTPNAHLGIALSLILVCRVGYKIAVSHFAGLNPGGARFEIATSPPTFDIVGSPLTLAIIGTMLGYFVTYAIGVMRRRRRAVPASAAGDGVRAP